MKIIINSKKAVLRRRFRLKTAKINLENLGTGQILFRTLTARPPLNGRPPPWKMEPQSGGGPAGRIDFNHLALLAPHLFSEAPALCAQSLSTRPLTPCLAHSTKKDETRASYVVRWRIPPFLCPQRRDYFQRGDIE